MTTNPLRLASLALVAGIAIGAWAAWPVQAPASPPAPLPAMRLTDLDGRAVTLDALRGRLVVLNVWATWCAPCRRELPSLDRLHAVLEPDQFAVIGIAVDDDRTTSLEYLRQRGVRFTNFHAVDRRELTAALDLKLLPATLVIAPDGNVLGRIEGARAWDTEESIASLRAVRLDPGRAAGTARSRS